MDNFIASQKETHIGIGDWPRGFIVGVLHSKGITLASLAKDNNLGSRTLSNTFCRKWPKGERIIAGALGVRPCEIWPSRYTSAEY
ncbi:helix-turn-helix domain-containing protein [Salmonella enterica]|uniref:helix-turn-helix domain-containing protein n=1 Tax=Salmonella enterica TaxID=28901 RepID=UPI0009AF9444|nr:helix-turn-helix domain-containing protein [Salmonella enterica]EBG8070628.1 transcriptional regulator [Salmonella enterica subsp. enterica serovar Elisabethville]EBR0085665.1 transcriptional regulator [Salmonella enterica subsp. enterica serovar Wangata]ECI6681044.1 transcriptional regulator [Salmonella enterica subsp. enterica]EEH1521426.1 transcriptional regulator [Salmonella enterica subsp. enterica serovar Telelkebir]EGG8165128.1 transcriptional regulator [Salmonella enterica subsp. en